MALLTTTILITYCLLLTTYCTSVRTLGPVKMLVLRGHNFHNFLDRVPDFRRRLKRIQQVRKSDRSTPGRPVQATACWVLPPVAQ